MIICNTEIHLRAPLTHTGDPYSPPISISSSKSRITSYVGGGGNSQEKMFWLKKKVSQVLFWIKGWTDRHEKSLYTTNVDKINKILSYLVKLLGQQNLSNVSLLMHFFHFYHRIFHNPMIFLQILPYNQIHLPVDLDDLKQIKQINKSTKKIKKKYSVEPVFFLPTVKWPMTTRQWIHSFLPPPQEKWSNFLLPPRKNWAQKHVFWESKKITIIFNAKTFPAPPRTK